MTKMNFKILFFVLTVFLISCTKESVSDSTKRDRERERDKNDSVFNEFKLTEGTYHGSTEKSDYLLKIQPAWTTPNGTSSASTPTIVGTLSFYPKVAMRGEEPLIMNLPITDGNYMDSSKNLSLSISSGDTNPSRMTCKVMPGNQLSCEWFTSRGAMQLEFITLPSKQESKVTRSNGNYTGTTDIFHDQTQIKVDFQTTLVVGNNGSSDRLAQTFVTAKFKFVRPTQHEVSFPPSSNGTYDPFTQSFTFSLQGVSGTNAIIVNCSILKANSLKCRWISNETFDFDLQLQNTNINGEPLN